MKKFIVRYTRPALFRGKGDLSVFEKVFDHAVDAWKCAQDLKARNTKDPRWPLLSLEIVFEKVA